MKAQTSVSKMTRMANADYTVVDDSPLHLRAGDVVDLGEEDRAWAGWIWIITGGKRGTFVPVRVLERTTAQQARVLEDFDAVDLSVKKGQSVIIVREVNGWFWCRDEAGAEGWVPDYILS